MSVTTPCFTPGTLIATETGQRPVELLRRGDRVVTRDNGLRRINWVGQRTYGYHDIRAEADLQPVVIRKDAFGLGFPQKTMVVSPSHRMLASLDLTPLTSGDDEALVAARHLVDGVRVTMASVLGVTYVHFLCHAHEVVLANGAWTESFHPDDTVLQSMADTQRGEILDIFPEIETIGAARRFPAARPVVKSRFEV